VSGTFAVAVVRGRRPPVSVAALRAGFSIAVVHEEAGVASVVEACVKHGHKGWSSEDVGDMRGVVVAEVNDIECEERGYRLRVLEAIEKTRVRWSWSSSWMRWRCTRQTLSGV
jgi:hypothetical protein